MDDLFVVKELEQLKALTDPLRLGVLGEAMGEPVTIAQVAERLGETPRKLYYHFTELERVGLLNVAETRQKGNLIEKRYQAVATFVSVDWAVFHRSPEGQEVLVRNVPAMLQDSALDFQRHMREGRLGREQIDRVWPLHSIVSLRDDHLLEFRERLRALIDEFRGREGHPSGPNAALTLLFYPFTLPVGTGEPKPTTDTGDDHD